MKKFLFSVLITAIVAAFAFKPCFATTYPDYGGYNGAIHGTDANSMTLEDSGTITVKSGGGITFQSGLYKNVKLVCGSV